MEVALVLCPAWSREMPHLALAMLSSVLRKGGHKVSVFDLNNDFYHSVSEEHKHKWDRTKDFFWTDHSFVSGFISENEEIIDSYVDKILKTEAKVIKFSVYYPNEIMSVKLANRIKERDKDKFIVFSGQHCLEVGHKDRLLVENNAVDAIIKGEEEVTLPELVNLIEEYGKVDFCEGALLRTDSDIIDCGDRDVINNLSDLPFADFCDFNLSKYRCKDSLPILSSRGCVQHCVFCNVNSFWKKYRSFSGERLFKEIECCKDKGVKHFDFQDASLNGNIKELERFCDLIIKGKTEGTFSIITWRGKAVIRPEMSADLLRKMKDAGCSELIYSIDSGSQKIVNKMNKHLMKIDDAERIIRETHDAGIRVVLRFMFGFPTETSDDFNETQDFIKRNHRYIHLASPDEVFCTINKNTYLYEHPEEFGILLDPDPELWQSIDNKNNYMERLKRFESFCELARSLNINLSTGCDKVRTSKEKKLKAYYAKIDEEEKLKKYLDGVEIKKDTSEPIFSRKNPPYKCFFTWEMSYDCNYSCTYCHAPKIHDPRYRKARYLEASQWVYVWRKIYKDYGESEIVISGGEPFIYPNFMDMAISISKIHILEFCTNLSFDVRPIVDSIHPKRARIGVSFHPEFSELDSFAKKVFFLRDSGFEVWVNFVPWPPFFSRIEELKNTFEPHGVRVVIQPFSGKYNGIDYPRGYTDEEKKILNIFEDIANVKVVDFKTTDKALKAEKFCRMGENYAFIHPDGTTDRCCKDTSIKLGNIIDGSFRLLEGPAPCQADRCNCWRCMLVATEPTWIKHWGRHEAHVSARI